jgi:hypothetical protein
VGGLVLATPGGGVMPISAVTMGALALAILVPTLALGWFTTRRAAIT